MSVRMATPKTEHDTAADGVVMPSFVAGDSGELTVDCQQTSQLHKLLLSLYNTLKTQANSGDISGWAATTIRLRTVLDGSGHILTGVSFQKIPDKPYESKGRMVTWVLMAADVQNM